MGPTHSVFSFFTCTCASRHNSVQFFISHLASWLRTRRFSEPTFRPPGATNHWKTQCFATFLPFRAPGSSFFSDLFFFDLLSSCLLFSDSSHLCFSFVHIVGSLTSNFLRLWLQVEPGQTGWRKFREGEKAIKTRKSLLERWLTPWMAVGFVISWTSLSLTFLALDILVWWCTLPCSTTRMQPFHCDLHPWIRLYGGGGVRAQNERKTHPSHKQGSPHRCREPLYARKRRVACDF